jgi:HlyD family secretion protein
LIHLNVARGQIVDANTNLFNIEQDDQLAQVNQSKAQLLSAKSQYNDLQTGKRPAELDVIKAQIKQAIASEKLAQINLNRDKAQFAIGGISKAQLDSSQTHYDVAIAKTKELQNDLKTGKLPGRDQVIKAQAAQISYADATLQSANWKLSQTIGMSPGKSLVYDTLYNQGEWVEAGKPVVILLPPKNLKVRFFVPEGIVGKLKIGSKMQVSCDGCKDNIDMQISYISNQAEYTPPVIFSNETRNKLVFRVEAKPANPNLLTMHPGQPVEVVLNDK